MRVRSATDSQGKVKREARRGGARTGTRYGSELC